MSNYTDTFRKPAMTDETGIAIAEKLSGDTASEYKVNISAEYRKAPMSDATAQEILAKIDGGGSGASALSELSDVTLTNPSDGQVLHYDGTEWINATPVAELPAVTSDDNGKILSVVEGEWTKAEASGIGMVIYEGTTSGNTFTLSNDKTTTNIYDDVISNKLVYLKNSTGEIYSLTRIGDSSGTMHFGRFTSTNIYDLYVANSTSFTINNKTLS